MSTLEHIFASMVNQHVEPGKEYKPPVITAHMPDDFYQEKVAPLKVDNEAMAAKLDAFIRATTR